MEMRDRIIWENLQGFCEIPSKKEANVVIPSFAVGRTQELLYFIREIKEKNLLSDFPNFDVYVDSPLAIEATSVFTKNERDCFDKEAMELVDQGINPACISGSEAFCDE